MNRVGKVVPKRGNQRLHILPIVNPPFKFYEGVIFSYKERKNNTEN
jgi:hypothetical protein